MSRRISSTVRLERPPSSGSLPGMESDKLVPRRKSVLVSTGSLSLAPSTPTGAIGAAMKERKPLYRRKTVHDGAIPLRPPSPAAEVAVGKAPSSQDRDAKVCTFAIKYRLERHEVRCIFTAFDQSEKNQVGGLSKEQFSKVMARIFEVVSVKQEVCEQAYFATAPEMSIDFEKFINWYCANMFTQVAALRGSQECTQSDSMVYDLAKKHNCRAITIDKVKTQFDKFDLDRSGEIDYSEFEDMMVIILGATTKGDISADRFQRFWKEIDKDGSGSVDFPEFAQWYLKYFNPESDTAHDGPVLSFYQSFCPSDQRQAAMDRRRSEVH